MRLKKKKKVGPKKLVIYLTKIGVLLTIALVLNYKAMVDSSSFVLLPEFNEFPIFLK